jgi:thiol:disulfide interchange protein
MLVSILIISNTASNNNNNNNNNSSERNVLIQTELPGSRSKIYILHNPQGQSTNDKSVKHLKHFRSFKSLSIPIAFKIFPRPHCKHTQPKQSTMSFTTKSSTKTFNDASSTYSTASTSTVIKEKENAKRKWLSKNKSNASNASNADSKNKDAALHNEAMAHYLAFR